MEAGLRVPLLGDELAKRESIVHNLSTAYTWLAYDAIQDTVCCTVCQAENTTHHPNSTAENVFFSGNTKFTALSDQCVKHAQQYHQPAPAVLPPPPGTFGKPLKGTDPNQQREDGTEKYYKPIKGSGKTIFTWVEKYWVTLLWLMSWDESCGMRCKTYVSTRNIPITVTEVQTLFTLAAATIALTV